ncbi:BA14K family protein [Rhizobium sp. 32-5/1]|uniref:BA14K family protein n=1 Tax=Rhizobium sp. 32-5/1 TaxID=3019602 RepID=UPI00240E6864|nr:BA14K family protein [Rhizobium sp. 32-5/1]WEZ82956.1 BA14K family protein [Rhizobium sp. 32-5/1]
MNTFIKAAVLAIVATATVLPTLSVAHAEDWRRHRRHHGHNDGIALGALGLATGVIIGGAIANSQPRYQERVYIDPEPDYYEPRPVYRRYEPRPVYRRQVVQQTYGSLEPWSPAWYRYCSQRYRSFNPDSGTFRGYDGRDYFCTAG